MKQDVLFAPDGMEYRLAPVTEETLDLAVEMCDLCVGKHLYSRRDLAPALTDPGYQFHFLTDPEGNQVGYIHTRITDAEEMSALSRLPAKVYRDLTPGREPVVGSLRSIGILPDYRRRHLSLKLTDYAIESVKAAGADFAVALCWVHNGTAPSAMPLIRIGFDLLAIADDVWSEVAGLDCPYCKGACHCKAAIYYKHLKEGPAQ